jgi:hypothetical protein
MFSKHIDEIFTFFLKNFSFYINNMNLYELKKNVFIYNSTLENLIKINNLIDYNIILNFTIVEFSDGIFNLATNKFYKDKDVFKKKNPNVFTLKYYNKTFKHLKFPKT